MSHPAPLQHHTFAATDLPQSIVSILNQKNANTSRSAFSLFRSGGKLPRRLCHHGRLSPASRPVWLVALGCDSRNVDFF